MYKTFKNNLIFHLNSQKNRTLYPKTECNQFIFYNPNPKNTYLKLYYNIPTSCTLRFFFSNFSLKHIGNTKITIDNMHIP